MTNPRQIAKASGTRKGKTAVAIDAACKPLPKSSGKVKPGKDLQEQLRRLGPYPRTAPGGIAGLARLRLDWHLDRAKIVDRWRRRSRLVDVQEQNFPTEEISVDLPEGQRRVRANRTRVRQSEAWRHKQLTPMQRQAETEMQIGWQVLTAGLSASVSRYDASRGIAHGSAQEISAGLDDDWLEWSRNALQEKIPLAVVIDIIAEPRTLAEIERARKLKRGSAFETYQRGLDLWCELRGWLRRSFHSAEQVT